MKPYSVILCFSPSGISALVHNSGDGIPATDGRILSNVHEIVKRYGYSPMNQKELHEQISYEIVNDEILGGLIDTVGKRNNYPFEVKMSLERGGLSVTLVRNDWIADGLNHRELTKQVSDEYGKLLDKLESADGAVDDMLTVLKREIATHSFLSQNIGDVVVVPTKAH